MKDAEQLRLDATRLRAEADKLEREAASRELTDVLEENKDYLVDVVCEDCNGKGQTAEGVDFLDIYEAPCPTYRVQAL